jgi:hypothetical protein
MPDKIITMEFDDTGFTVDTEGFHGEGCDAIHDAMAELGESQGREYRPEYYQTNHQNNVIRSGR